MVVAPLARAQAPPAAARPALKMSRRGGAVTPAESWQEGASFGTPPTNTPSYVARSEPSRASRLTGRNLDGDFASQANSHSSGPGSKKTQSVTSSKRNVPKKKVAWEDDSSDESPDEWEFAERGPLAKLRLKNQGETAKERAALGFYVDEAEYGDEYDFSDVAMWKKPIGNDPDFIGPESYPRRMRDSHGYYIWFVMFFASMVVGWNGIGNGKPEHLWHLRDHAGNLCGLGEMKQQPHLWHPFAHDDPSSTEMHPGVGVCVDECPHAGDWVCVKDSAQDEGKKRGSKGRRLLGLFAAVEGSWVHGSMIDKGRTTGIYGHKSPRRALRSVHQSSPREKVTGESPTPNTNGPLPTRVSVTRGRSLLANATKAKPNATACENGAWTAVYLDYAPTFNACVPAADQSNSTHSPAAKDRAIKEAHAVVDTPERTFSNLLSDVYIARWCILVAVVITTLISYGMLMALENGAAAFTALAFTSAIILQLVIAAALGAQAIGQDAPVVGTAVITNVDTRMGPASVITTWILPVIGACFAASAAGMIWYYVTSKKSLALATLFLDQSSVVLQLTGLNFSIPLLTFVPLCGVTAWLASGVLSLSAMASEWHHSGDPDAEGWHWVYRGATVFHAWFCLWCLSFFVFFVRFIVSSHVNTWYWAREPREEALLDTSLSWAVGRCLSYHAGSLALLGVYTAAYAPLRAYVRLRNWITRRKPSPDSNALMFRGGAVCQIALHGTSLRRGASWQLHLKMRNDEVVRQCLGAAGSALLAGLITAASISAVITTCLTHVMPDADEVNVGLVPAAVSAAMSAAIYVTFFTSYAEAIETILQCFCEDMERNDGTPLRQYYMPESLKKLIFEEVKGQVMPSETDADDKFELEMKEARKTRREAKRERRRVRESQAGSQSGGGASSMSGSYT